MTKIAKYFFLFFLVLYFASTMYLRYDGNPELGWSLFNGLPWDVYPLKNFRVGSLGLKERDISNMKTQIGTLSALEVAELFEKNPEHFPGCYDGIKVENLPVKEYIVLRFKVGEIFSDWRGGSVMCTYKCYTPGFPNLLAAGSIERKIFMAPKPPEGSESYCNVVFPYPDCLNKESTDPLKLFVRWNVTRWPCSGGTFGT